jgi:hypothetical protein
VQASAPRLLGGVRPVSGTIELARFWVGVLALIPAALAVLALVQGSGPAPWLTATLVVGLLVFGVVFALNSALHSYLILVFTLTERVTMDVGFYYMSNAAGPSARDPAFGSELPTRWPSRLSCHRGGHGRRQLALRPSTRLIFRRPDMLIHRLASSIALAACIAAPVLAQDRDVLAKGGGSTFAAPLDKAWIDASRSIAPAVDISIGSGEGIARFLDVHSISARATRR